MATIKETTTTTAPAEPLADVKEIVQNLAFKLWSRAGARAAIETMHPLWSSYRVDCELSKNWHALSADVQKPWLDRAAEKKKCFDAKKALVATVLAPAPAPTALVQPESAVVPVVAPRAEPAPEPVAAAEAGPVPMEDAPEPAAELAPAPAPMALPQLEPVGPVVAPMGLSVGDKVEALWPANGLYYPALVTAIHDNGTIALYYDDGDTRSDARVSELRTIVSESDYEDIPAAPKSQYEIERDERIERNEAFMRSLGLGGGLGGLAAVGAQIRRPPPAPRPKHPRDWEPRKGERRSSRLAGESAPDLFDDVGRDALAQMKEDERKQGREIQDEPEEKSEPEEAEVEPDADDDVVDTDLAGAEADEDEAKPPPKKLPRKKAPAAAPPQTSAALSSLGRRLNTEVNGLALALVRAPQREAQFLAYDLLVASREYDALQDAAGALRQSETSPERLKTARAPKVWLGVEL